MQYTHKLTGSIFEVIKTGAKVIVLRCVTVGAKAPSYHYIGQDTKTSPAGLLAFFIPLN